MATYSLIDTYRDDPVVNEQLKTGRYKQEMCGCFDNCGVCILTYFLPCVQFGTTAQDLGKSCCVYGCLHYIPISQIIVQCSQRSEIREIRGIPGDDCEDCAISTFCMPCGVCQDAVEVEAIKLDINNILMARNSGGAVVVQTHMQQGGPVQQNVSPGYMARV